MSRVSRTRVGRFLPVTAVIALIGAAAMAAALAPGARHSWTFQGEHFAVIDIHLGPAESGATETIRSTVRIWYDPGVGSRLEVESDGTHGARSRVFVTNGVRVWSIDPLTNRYAVGPTTPALIDPRVGLVVMMTTAGASTYEEALASMRRLPDVGVTEEGVDVVAGRQSRVVRVAPFSCVHTASSTSDGTTTGPSVRCAGFSRSWLDAATGWVLRAEAEDGNGGGFTWDTHAADFHGPIRRSLFHFRPPPGSVQVDRLD